MSTTAPASSQRFAQAVADARKLFELFVHAHGLTDAEARLAFGQALVGHCKSPLEAERMLQRLMAAVDDRRAKEAAQVAAAQKARA